MPRSAPSAKTGTSPPDLGQWFSEESAAVLYMLMDNEIPRDQAEVSLQEAGAKAITKCELRSRSAFRSWLYITARNWWTDKYSDKRKNKGEKATVSFHDLQDDDGNPGPDPPSTRDLAGHGDTRAEILRQCLEQLPVNERAMIDERWFVKPRATYQEIADRYGLCHPHQAQREIEKILGKLQQILYLQFGVENLLAFEDFLGGNQ